ncbi:ABC transporter permease [Taibaiella chishuiensis]|uniref:Putative ABC transport system permease protein n=1 Tax=Taibaiella chishuiensis TaxID=1434707 RepID=A0A2P8CSS6_9BACT|nr:ABC transporter permease [Taibaiella chishuiensis]PSK88021.1 putative ABC transport system permease protein [Taibaiella chishuiensis]
MRQFVRIVTTSFKIAIQELRVNKLRTFLSLLGVTIGIFCIVAVFTVLDSLEKNIHNTVASLGDDVLYINKWPWMDEGGEYKWWEYRRRKVMTTKELKAIEHQSQTVRYATLCYSNGSITARQSQYEISGISGYAVTPYFEKMQNFEIGQGRYFNNAELNGGNNFVVLGYEVSQELFPGNMSPVGRPVSFWGKRFTVIGVLKKAGDNVTGFNFDRGLLLSYYTAAGILNVTDNDANMLLMVKAKPGIGADELSYETEGILRAVRRVQPGVKNDFSINKLSQITERLNTMFAMIDLVGLVIAFFSLLVGGFGIANIMFVSVKERTRIIGLKKAIGAKRREILTEFLIEAITLCLIGGLIGIILVMLMGLVLTGAMGFAVTLSAKNFMIGIGISTVVGILAGYIPARSASRLDPVVAIRST